MLRRCGLALGEIADLAERAAAWGASPLDLALGEGRIAESAYLAVLAGLLGAEVTHDPPPPLAGSDARECFVLRRYPAKDAAGNACQVIAPDAQLACMLLAHLTDPPHFAAPITGRLLLTPRQSMLAALFAAEAPRRLEHAVARLPSAFSARPEGLGWRRAQRLAQATTQSAQTDAARFRAPLSALFSQAGILAGFARRSRAIGLACLLAFAGLAWFAPAAAITLPPLLLTPIFLLGAIATLSCLVQSCETSLPAPSLNDAQLPRYSLLVPLYREGEVLARLLERLSRLDYPRDRLELILLLEADDAQTRHALRALSNPPPFLHLVLPEGQPRTKPRALNIGLYFATGDLIAVYDAEDAPEPGQLREAAGKLASSAPEIACLQARLAISNSADNFLSARFALDYAGLFDVIKAGMARLGWPVPLGGTSNHFRTAILRRIGGWDAWNVTEDADIGIRLARFGYRVEDLNSSTWEEAPNSLQTWLNQRTRWLKGWFQTLIVHGRAPGPLIAQLGLFQTIVTGSVALSLLLGALLYPILVVLLAARLGNGAPLGGGSLFFAFSDALVLILLGIGILIECLPAVLGLKRRRALHLLPYIALAPVTYGLISIAAWRALWELKSRPFHWHKTRHGTARSEGGLASLSPSRPLSRAGERSTPND